MIKACIFDLDGTLADTLDSIASITNKILSSYGLKMLPVENYKYYSGEGGHKLMERCLKEAGDTKLVHLEEGFKRYTDEFAKDPMYHVNHYKEMPETIDYLHDNGYKLGVCSNKPHKAAVKVVSQLFGVNFQKVVGQQQNLKRKPAPDGPLLVAKDLGVKPKECLYIGDTATDMQTGKNAGMVTVGVLWGFRDKEELIENKADYIAEKPEDIIEIIREINNKE